MFAVATNQLPAILLQMQLRKTDTGLLNKEVQMAAVIKRVRTNQKLADMTTVNCTFIILCTSYWIDQIFAGMGAKYLLFWTLFIHEAQNNLLFSGSCDTKGDPSRDQHIPMVTICSLLQWLIVKLTSKWKLAHLYIGNASFIKIAHILRNICTLFCFIRESSQHFTRHERHCTNI